jgi:SPP1 gp7 family putative phage head morphogenesis protein
MIRKTGRTRERALRPVHPNAGIEVKYRRRLRSLIDAMQNSFAYWIKAAYRANEPLMAQDDSLPATNLVHAVRELAKRWQANFDEAAPRLAAYFAKSALLRSDAALKKILRDGGFSVKWKMTREMRDVMEATIAEQVGLIKSIPQHYLTQVEGLVMRSVQTGRDLGQLAKDLAKQYGVTKKRAALIARDQNNKATAAMSRARQDALGIVEGDWVHSGAGRHPRPTHVAMNGKRFNLRQGMWDSAENRYILPGELINCRCIWRPVIKGFT